MMATKVSDARLYRSPWTCPGGRAASSGSSGQSGFMATSLRASAAEQPSSCGWPRSPGGERFERTGFGFRYQGLKLWIGRQQFIDQGVVLLRIQRLDGQQPLIGHLDDNGFTRVGAFIQRLLEVRLQPA